MKDRSEFLFHPYPSTTDSSVATITGMLWALHGVQARASLFARRCRHDLPILTNIR